MKEITNITPNSIHYIDEENNTQLIDFESCHQNYVKRMGSRYTDERKEFYQASKYVGVRYAFSDPPAIVFYTVQPTTFEFPTRERLGEIAYRVKKAGWRTNDGE